MGYRVNYEGTTVTYQNRPVALQLNRDGYYRFSFGPKTKRRNLRVHRLQAFQTYGEDLYEMGIVCRHIDGNSHNNHASNIILGTQSQNVMDMTEEARKAKAKRAASKLKKYDYQLVRDFYNAHGFRAAMAHFGIKSKGSMHYILKNTITRSTAL